MLSDEEIWKFWWARPDVPDGEDDSMEAQFIAAARAIEREATAPLMEQIKEDEVLMLKVLAILDCVASDASIDVRAFPT